jgi:alkyl hydroperoxide reductase subunit AhpF
MISNFVDLDAQVMLVILVSRDANLTAIQPPGQHSRDCQDCDVQQKLALISYHDPYINHMMLISQPFNPPVNTREIVKIAMCNKTSPDITCGWCPLDSS